MGVGFGRGGRPGAVGRGRGIRLFSAFSISVWSGIVMSPTLRGRSLRCSYSCRKAVRGSMAVTWRAGMKQATPATVRNNSETARNVSTSVGLVS